MHICIFLVYSLSHPVPLAIGPVPVVTGAVREQARALAVRVARGEVALVASAAGSAAGAANVKAEVNAGVKAAVVRRHVQECSKVRRRCWALRCADHAQLCTNFLRGELVRTDENVAPIC